MHNLHNWCLKNVLLFFFIWSRQFHLTILFFYFIPNHRDWDVITKGL